MASGGADLADIRLSGFGLGAARIYKDSLGHALQRVHVCAGRFFGRQGRVRARLHAKPAIHVTSGTTEGRGGNWGGGPACGPAGN